MKAAALVAAVLTALPLFAVAKEDPRRVGAKEHYERGLAHFHLQEYQAAIEEFQEAYRLRPDPVFLYNLGQAYRLADNPQRALYFYRDFLRTAENPPNRAEVEGRITDLERAIESKQKLSTPPDHTLPPKETGQPAAPALAPSAVGERPAAVNAMGPPLRSPDRTPVYKKWWLWTIVGGVVVAGAAVATAVVLTSSSHFDANIGTFGPNAIRINW